ncbi:acyl carrier protein [Caulobacter sp. RL271]|uniref:Phosphopantetheine-binding protein n=1 Tax=Caulobacter segnis TaxID=88688 RepID=A0ABY4ZX46_9CAUL|nr:phosphopantetheine-binding protein [Caulobacter segnis]USQ97278.1 phosphopantetheine-binding protein [Caulobacter segnis]
MTIDTDMAAMHADLDAETANAVREKCAARVRKIVLEVLNIPASDRKRGLPDSAGLHIEWGADSLDLIDITMSVEDEFDISIPDAEADLIDSIDAIVDRVLKGPAPKGALS